MKRTRRFSSANLRVEPLEDRRMLAVGTFLRTGGTGANTGDSGTAIAGANNMISNQANAGDTVAISGATAIASDENAFAFFHGDSYALVDQPTGSAAVHAPFVSASNIGEVTATGSGRTWSNTIVANAASNVTYQPDPVYKQNLHVYDHLFIAATSGNVGSAAVTPWANTTLATINGYWARADYIGGDEWIVSNNVGAPQYTSIGGANFHIVIIDGEIPNTLGATTNNGLGATGPLGSANVTSVAGAWGYVDGQPPTSVGDFNADGLVNEADYSLWAEGSPLADVNQIGTFTGGGYTGIIFDGKVDVLDYSIWAQHSNAIVVSTTVDENDGNYSYGDLSLREAIALAANAQHPGTDNIAFDSGLFGQTLSLTGALNISGSNPVRILGPGSDQLTIRGTNVGFTMFNFTGGNSSVTSEIAGVTITTNALPGATLYTTAVGLNDASCNHDLVLDSVVITANGTGVRNSDGQLTIRNSTISNNYWDGINRSSHSQTAFGSSVDIIDSQVVNNARYGINVRSLHVTIEGSEIDGNGVNTRNVWGGGISVESDEESPDRQLTIRDSTIAENHGWGIVLNTEMSGDIANSTISSNVGTTVGGGILTVGCPLTLTNDTITQNTNTTVGGTAGVYASGETVTMHNTIVSENYAGTKIDANKADLGRAASESFVTDYSLIGVVGNSGVTSSNHNIILGSSLNAGLMALGDYGGRTRTHALLLSSLAVDAGNDAAISEMYDERGIGFARKVNRIAADDSDPNDGGSVDIGAFELGLGELYG